jgi:ribonuclease HI
MFVSKVHKKSLFNNIKISMNNPVFKVYTDGACTNNGKVNAKCSIGIHFPSNNFIHLNDISEFLHVKKSSNNVAELTAIKRSLEIIKQNKIVSPINIYTDSMYSKNCIEKWYPNWVKQNIVKKKQNNELITDIYNLYSSLNEHNNIKLNYIKAHTGLNDEDSIGNQKADELATNALKFENKIGDIRNYFK